MNTIKTLSGRTFITNKRISFSFRILKLDYEPKYALTGKVNNSNKNWSELEFSDQFGRGGFICEDYILQP